MSYSSEVLADSPIAYWRMDEASGATVADSSGNGRTATLSGSYTRNVTGLLVGDTNKATTLASGAYAETTSGFANPTTITLEAVIKPSGSWPKDGQILNRDDGSGRRIFQFRRNADGTIQFILWNSSNSITNFATTDTVPIGTTAHVAATYDGTTARIYINGVQKASASATGNLNSNGAFGVRIGGQMDLVSNAWFIGTIDELAIYGTALSATRIAAHATAATVASVPNQGVGTGSFAFSGAAVGKRVAAGVAAGAFAFSGAAVGSTTRTGSAAGSHTSVGSAVGLAPILGAAEGDASGSHNWAGVAVGSTFRSGSKSGAFAWAGVAVGSTPVLLPNDGTASGSFSWTGVAVGVASRTGLATGAHAWTGAAVGTNAAIPFGTAVGSHVWAGVAVGDNFATEIPAWDADESGIPVLEIDTPTGELDMLPPLALPPAGYVERPIYRSSRIVPALHTISGAVKDEATGAYRLPDHVYDALPVTEEEVGVPHIIYQREGGSLDITYYRGGITQLLRDRREEPFGDLDMDLDFQRITSLDDEPDNSSHPLWWFVNRANVEVVFKKSDGTIRRGVWTGHYIAHQTGNTETDVTSNVNCFGTLRQAASDVLKVPNILEPTDIGKLIPRALNGVTSRRYPMIPYVTTGIMSRNRGSWQDNPLGHAQNLLATAWTESGRQWTVAKVEGSRRSYEMRLKADTPSWTVTNGARGVTVDLTRDESAIRNVIYGYGVAPNGYSWSNTKYPNLHLDTAPLYPGSLMGLGASGSGVTTWQRRARDLGYSIPVDGTISSSDVSIIKTIQRRFGLQVDGVIGPQTWAATFGVGANAGDLKGVTRLPLAADPRTQKWLYNADGSIAGDNPEWDQNVIIYADNVDFGTGITRAEGIEAAQQLLEREGEAGLTGRIVLRSDPREGSRMLIQPGSKMTLVGYEQANRVLHITSVERDWQNLSVTLTVDEKSRDAMTVAQIRERDRESRKTPARRPGNLNNRRSASEVDQVVPFDGESGAGRIPKHALFGGLWTVIRIPVSELGRVALVDFQTSSPATKMCVLLFGAPITPAHLIQYVGANPLALDDPTQTHREVLEDRFGYIEGWGRKGDAGGYFPKGEGNQALNGHLRDTGGFEYVSAKPPWIWVAEWVPNSCLIEGRILPAPVV